MSQVWLDWFVITKKTVVMQRLADLVRTGHHHYIVGQISPEKAGHLAGKLDMLYGVGLNRLEQSRKRKTGQASFRLLMLQQVDQENLTWWLLRTDGGIPPEAVREKWRDALSDRVHITGYELIRQPRAGQPTPAWTWRYEPHREQDLRDSIIRAIRTGRDDQLRQLIDTIWRTPGFSAAREQVKKMGALILSNWKRGRGNDPLPKIPERLGYVRRIPDIGRKLSELGLRAERKTKPN
jgi:hypothetical protein